MRHMQVVGSANPAMLEIRTDRSASMMPSANAHHDTHPDPFDLVLAGLGGSTANSMIDHAIDKGWNLYAVYIELALYGENSLAGNWTSDLGGRRPR